MSICLKLDSKLTDQYKSPCQKVRVLTEEWVDKEIYCPSCGNARLDKYSNNKPVADFFCRICNEDFELKSKKGSVGLKIVDGAYQAMLARLGSIKNPNLFLLNYELESCQVLNFFVIPKHFFVPDIIEKRTPLSESAKRAGWVGCNILLRDIPNTGKIYYIRNKQVEPKNAILHNWKKTLFLRETKNPELKGWILDVMCCMDRLGRNEFSLQDMYAFEHELRNKHPNNRHIKDKIRQQLQFLRDRGYLEFLGGGNYKKRK